MNLKLKTIKLLKSVYKILYRKQSEDHELKTSYGYIDHDLKGIVIDKTFSKSRQLQTLMHEIFHLIEDEQKLKFTEREIDKLAEGFIKLLNQNNLYIIKKKNKKK